MRTFIEPHNRPAAACEGRSIAPNRPRWGTPGKHYRTSEDAASWRICRTGLRVLTSRATRLIRKPFRHNGAMRTYQNATIALACSTWLACCGWLAPLLAQSQPPVFEAASVKPNRSATGVAISIQGGNVRMTGVTVRQLLGRAFGVEAFDIEGAPRWIATDRFDVVAKAPPDATIGQINAMVGGLLAERFGLRSHVEQRDSKVLFLTTVRDDGQLGPSIMPTKLSDCAEPQAAGVSQPAGSSERCGLRIGVGRIEGTGQPLGVLANAVATVIGQTVIDQTAVPGRFDFTLAFAPERDGTAQRGDGQQTTTGDGTSIYTALKEQLGLRVDKRPHAVSILVVDAIVPPEP